MLSSLIILLIFSPPPSERINSAVKEENPLQGYWKLTAIDLGGLGKQPSGDQGKWLIRGDRVHLLDAKGQVDKAQHVKIRLDRSKRPPVLELIWSQKKKKTQTYRAIYKIVGRNLTLAVAFSKFPLWGGGEPEPAPNPPKDFTGKIDNKAQGLVIVAYFERAKP